MVNNCCVVGCTNFVGKRKGISFYRFPHSDKERCGRWTAAVCKKDWLPNAHSRICNEHFKSGKPHHHPSHPDYVPSVFPAVYRKQAREKDMMRVHRHMARLARQVNQQAEQHKVEKEKKIEEIERERQDRKQKLKVEKAKLQEEKKKQRKHQEEAKARVEEEKRLQEEEEKQLEDARRNQLDETVRKLQEKKDQLEAARSEMDKELFAINKEICQVKDLEGIAEWQCSEVVPDFSGTMIHAEQQTDVSLTALDMYMKENAVLKEKLAIQTCGFSMIRDDDNKTCFYTGLPSWAVFHHVFNFLSPHVVPSCSISLENEFLLVLMRLRLGLLIEDLSARFTLTTASTGRSFQKWLDVMYCRLKFLIKWPSRDIIRENMPPAFRQLYPDCVCIIDCSEIYIDMPSRYEARSITYSNYKKHNTIKFLIGITPCRSIAFLSKCWGGRVSDKMLTQESDFLHHIEPGNVVLADRGFTIADDLAIYSWS